MEYKKQDLIHSLPQKLGFLSENIQKIINYVFRNIMLIFKLPFFWILVLLIFLFNFESMMEKKEKSNTNNYIYIGMLLVLVIVAMIATFMYRHRK